METTHKILFGDAKTMDIADNSVDLVVTSPPYPMIEMWDEQFAEMNPEIRKALKRSDGKGAFESMHQQLDVIWQELYRVLRDGGIACINIGDATRKVGDDFQLYSNHARIVNAFINIGFSNMPNILWRKQTNAPNKFMGSGMMPPSAYVTLEHEYILIFRKGGKRTFSKNEKSLRRESAYFWEERNQWFSDLWDFKGIFQDLADSNIRDRSAAFPFELPYRLINMFSIKKDTVLDPFLGTGTTSLAALCSGRNSIGYEIDKGFSDVIFSLLHTESLSMLNDRIRKRILDHKKFVKKRLAKKDDDAFKYENNHYGFPVITKQEKPLLLNYLKTIDRQYEGTVRGKYFDEAMLDYPQKGTLFAEVNQG
ncbi:site-specific DNA-methyltransferase [Fodinibius sp. Rm-B-1B1-1]|uniref:DNA-methyltransferase n=1 Tax=Fodinibius alkaliphilus TaxID=3140241 RepID=UPI00315A2288